MDQRRDAALAPERFQLILIGCFALIAIVLAAAGVYGTMSYLVARRTREIGIRMAIGARSAAIRRQFLIESVTLSVVGGVFGILMGVGASITISKTLGWPTLISPISIVASVIFSMLVGVAFGYYPARKAAGLDPIDALRYE